MATAALDAFWLRRRPLPAHPEGTDKNSRGRALIVGGSTLVPGGIRLTAEAAFRAGAGKVQIATIAPAALAIGLAMPEAAAIGLPVDAEGEIGPEAGALLAPYLAHADCLALGPAISSNAAAGRLVEQLLAEPRDGLTVLLDAGCCAGAGAHEPLLRRHGGRLILTPHRGEMAGLTGLDPEAIDADRDGAVRDAARRFQAVVLLKGATTVLADPGGETLHYAGGGVGLATGGSGDTLAGLIAGLAARGLPPWEATAWGVWLHGEAGRRLAERLGPMGFLARELLPEIPALMRGVY